MARRRRKEELPTQDLAATIQQGLHSLVVEIGTLTPDPDNVRLHDEDNIESIRASLKRFKQRKPIVVRSDTRTVEAGNGTLTAAKRLGWTHIAAVVVEEDEVEAAAYAIADNRTAELAAWDAQGLVDIIAKHNLDPLEHALGFTVDALAGIMNHGQEGATGGDAGAPVNHGSLSNRFLVPPFSVLNAREGWWSDRKRLWLSFGIKSEEGRTGLGDTSASGMDYFNKGKTIAGDSGSVFDPVLCELAYSWFCPPGGCVFDPFAGGSVRGVVAAKLGRRYHGVELRQVQVDANRKQWKDISATHPGGMKAETPEDFTPDRQTQADTTIQPVTSVPVVDPVWQQGDSVVVKMPKKPDADLVFSCPPYADLEVYSDDPADISNMSYVEFMDAYRVIIKRAVARLKPNRFAVWVIGEVRDPAGAYRNLVGDTVKAFQDAGADYYNEAIVITPAGTLPIRAGRQFAAGRKLGKCHQNFLVFVKGDAKVAATRCGDVVVHMPSDGQ